MEPREPPPPAGDELRRRATGAAAQLGVRSLLVLGVAVASNLVLARLLVPGDFGLLALGTSIVLLGTQLAEAGLGAALIRREEEPTRSELEALNGLQLAVTGALALAALSVGAMAGRDGLVVGVMVATLPIAALRTPSVIVLERRLQFGPIALVDVVEAVLFYAWALAAVALGMGVWGLATAAVVRAVGGTAVMLRRGPLGLMRPRWSLPAVRPLVGFGARIQLVSLTSAVREQALNAAVAVLAGLATLGVWNLAFRVLAVPYAFFTTVGRISYPTISRVLSAGGDVRAAVERGLGTVAVANGVLLVAIAAFAPALPALVGPGWGDLPATLLWSSVALVLGGPTSVVLSSYLYAAGEARSVLRAVVVLSVAWLAITLPLVDSVGAPMIGLGWIAATIAGSIGLWRRTRQLAGVRLSATLWGPTAAALAALAAGWAIGSSGEADVARGLLGVVAAEAILLGGLVVASRSLLRDTWRLAAESVGRT